MENDKITAYDMINGITYIGINQEAERGLLLNDYSMTPTIKIAEYNGKTIEGFLINEYEKITKGERIQLMKEQVVSIRTIAKNKKFSE